MPNKLRKQMLSMTNVGIFTPKHNRKDIIAQARPSTPPQSDNQKVQEVMSLPTDSEKITATSTSLSLDTTFIQHELPSIKTTSSYEDLYDMIGRCGTPNSAVKDKITVSSHLSLYLDSFGDKITSIDWPHDPINLPESARKTQAKNIRCIASTHYKISDLSPNKEAIHRTQQAIKDFFITAHAILTETGAEFPLASKNKCLGFGVIKGNKSVFIAISQSEYAREDLSARTAMKELIKQMNEKTSKWRFELVKTPQPIEYVMPRLLNMRTTRPASPNEVAPRMRCVEVAISVAFNKVRGSIKYEPTDAAMLAVNSTLWANSDTLQSNTQKHFGTIKRNNKYLFAEPLEVELIDGSKGYIDIWSPCKEHCAIYLRHMLAVAASDEHFLGPRADDDSIPTSTLLI